MKKIYFLVLLLPLLISCGPIYDSDPVLNSDIPIPTTEEAFASRLESGNFNLYIPLGGMTTDLIATASFTYKLNFRLLDDNSRVIFVASASPGAELHGEIVGAADSIVATTSGGGGNRFLLDKELPAGNYYLRVKDESKDAATCSYPCRTGNRFSVVSYTASLKDNGVRLLEIPGGYSDHWPFHGHVPFSQYDLFSLFSHAYYNERINIQRGITVDQGGKLYINTGEDECHGLGDRVIKLSPTGISDSELGLKRDLLAHHTSNNCLEENSRVLQYPPFADRESNLYMHGNFRDSPIARHPYKRYGVRYLAPQDFVDYPVYPDTRLLFTGTSTADSNGIVNFENRSDDYKYITSESEQATLSVAPDGVYLPDSFEYEYSETPPVSETRAAPSWSGGDVFYTLDNEFFGGTHFYRSSNESQNSAGYYNRLSVQVLSAVNLTSGEYLWRQELSKARIDSNKNILLDYSSSRYYDFYPRVERHLVKGNDGNVYAGSRNGIYAFSQNGTQLWHQLENLSVKTIIPGKDGEIYAHASIRQRLRIDPLLPLHDASKSGLYAIHANGSIKWFHKESEERWYPFIVRPLMRFVGGVPSENMVIGQDGILYFNREHFRPPFILGYPFNTGRNWLEHQLCAYYPHNGTEIWCTYNEIHFGKFIAGSDGRIYSVVYEGHPIDTPIISAKLKVNSYNANGTLAGTWPLHHLVSRGSANTATEIRDMVLTNGALHILMEKPPNVDASRSYASIGSANSHFNYLTNEIAAPSILRVQSIPLGYDVELAASPWPISSGNLRRTRNALDDDHGSNFADATSLAADTPVKGSLFADWDEDFFVINVNGATSVNITLEALSTPGTSTGTSANYSLQPQLELFASDGTSSVPASPQNTIGANTNRVYDGLVTNTQYYLRINGASNGHYSLSFSQN